MVEPSKEALELEKYSGEELDEAFEYACKRLNPHQRPIGDDEDEYYDTADKIALEYLQKKHTS